jgi:hypothetical protein
LHPEGGSVIIVIRIIIAMGVESMNKPAIMTAIPKRRYKYGEFTVVV